MLIFEGSFDFGQDKDILDLLFSFLVIKRKFLELGACIKSKKKEAMNYESLINQILPFLTQFMGKRFSLGMESHFTNKTLSFEVPSLCFVFKI